MTTAADAPKVAIVILNWNGRDDVLRCVSTLACLRYPNYVATVVDNASTDGSVAALRARFPEQRVVVMDKNLGFCGGNNRGIADALDAGAAYVLLVNNDTAMHPDLLDELVRVAAGDPAIAAVGAKNVSMDDHARLWGAYGELCYDHDLVRLVGGGAPDGPAFRVVQDVDWVIGNGILLRRRALDAIGTFDEAFFAYHEDVDWCVRARRAGWRIVYNGHAIIYHRGSGASDPQRQRPFPVLYFLSRNSVLFARKHASPAQFAKFAGLFLLTVAWRLLTSPWRVERAKSHLWRLRGFIDGVRGRLPLRALGIQ